MIRKGINQLISLAAEATGVDEAVAKHAIRYQFEFIRDWVNNPQKASILLHELGTFYIQKSAVDARIIRKAIPQIRKYPEDQYCKDYFCHLWQMRRLAQEYLKSRKKDNNSRKYGRTK